MNHSYPDFDPTSAIEVQIPPEGGECPVVMIKIVDSCRGGIENCFHACMEELKAAAHQGSSPKRSEAAQYGLSKCPKVQGFIAKQQKSNSSPVSVE